MSSKWARTGKWAGAALLAALASAALPPPATADDVLVVNPSAPYPEGPVVDGKYVYYAEMGGDRVMRWDGHANSTVWTRKGCGPTSVARGQGGTLVVLCHIEARIAIITPAGKTVRIIDRDSTGQSFVDPNASINDAHGGVYISSSGTFSPSAPSEGAVLYLDAEGGLRRMAEGIHYSNGVALSPDGKVLFVSEHLSRQILAYDVAADGTLSGKRVFLKLDDVVGPDPERTWEVGPDGLSMDHAGNLYMAEYGGGRVIIVDRMAKLIAIIPFPEQYTTAPVLIDGERRLFVTAPVSLFDPTEPGKVYSVANPAFGRN
jgi:sugar lactone lactonase YvrE